MSERGCSDTLSFWRCVSAVKVGHHLFSLYRSDLWLQLLRSRAEELPLKSERRL